MTETRQVSLYNPSNTVLAYWSHEEDTSYRTIEPQADTPLPEDIAKRVMDSFPRHCLIILTGDDRVDAGLRLTADQKWKRRESLGDFAMSPDEIIDMEGLE